MGSTTTMPNSRFRSKVTKAPGIKYQMFFSDMDLIFYFDFSNTLPNNNDII
ncbi:hypothetical protein L195_g060449, partial [Trifolium pratense]